MTFKSFSFMPKELDIAFYYEVWNEISNLKWYFYKFAGANADEAMQRTLFHTLSHFNSNKGNLSAYIKKLAREITKENNRLVLVDFLENTLSDSDETEEELKSSVDTGNIADFSTALIDEMELNENRRSEIVELALEFMDKFILLCDALIKHDTSTRYYPDIFIKNCLALSKKCPDFNRQCLDIYMEYEDDFKWFLEFEERDENWKEPDFVTIRKSYSKRVKLVNANGDDIEDADLEDFVLQGKIGEGETRKKIIKVHYYDLWEYFCDLIDDTETNALKFVIDDNYIIRTFGGSLSVLNTDLFNAYDLMRSEILTNVLQDTGGRILNVGSENIYLICNENMNKECMERTVHDYSFSISYTDITDKVVS